MDAPADRGAPALERDVVVGRGGAPGRGARGREVVGVDRYVALGGEAVAAALRGVVAAAEELHRVGDDLDRLALVARLVGELTPLQAPVHGDRAALAQEARAVLALRAPDRHVEVVGLVDPFAGRAVLATGVGSDPQ